MYDLIENILIDFIKALPVFISLRIIFEFLRSLLFKNE